MHNHAQPLRCVNKFSSVLLVNPEMRRPLVKTCKRNNCTTDLFHLQDLVWCACVIACHLIDVYWAVSESSYRPFRGGHRERSAAAALSGRQAASAGQLSLSSARFLVTPGSSLHGTVLKSLLSAVFKTVFARSMGLMKRGNFHV